MTLLRVVGDGRREIGLGDQVMSYQAWVRGANCPRVESMNFAFQIYSE